MNKKVEFLGIEINGKNLLIGFQHVFAMIGATILVPILTNMSIAMALITAGLGTIAFHFISGRKVPVFLGSSFAFLGALMANIPSADVAAAGDPVWQDAMGAVSVAIMIAGLIYVALSYITKAVGPDKIKKLFPPIVVGPVIMVIGLGLAPVALGNVGPGADYKTWITFLVTAATIIVCSLVTFKGKVGGFIKIIPILIGIIVGYICAAIFGLVDFSGLSNDASGWVVFQRMELNKTIVGFAGNLRFEWGVILAISPLAIVTFMEHLGDINANGAIVGKNFFEDPGVHKTLLGDGVATFTAGFLGGPVNTTYGENTAVLALTKNYNPKLLLLSGMMAVVLGVFTKFGALLGTVPWAVIGGASMILYGMIAAAGLRTMVDAKVNFTDTKNMIIVSLILVIGLGLDSGAVAIGNVGISPLALATVVGIILNVILPEKKVSAIAPPESGGSEIKKSE